MRTRAALLWSIVLTVTAIGASTQVTGPVATGHLGAAAPGPHASTPGAVALLRHWDHQRAAAWSGADPRALASLYAPGSAAGRRDVAMLTEYRRRGLRVTGIHQQVFAVATVRRSPDRLVLLVTDRLVDAVARRGGVGLALPHDDWSTRRVTWRRVGGRWLVAQVRDATPVTDGPGQPAR